MKKIVRSLIMRVTVVAVALGLASPWSLPLAWAQSDLTAPTLTNVVIDGPTSFASDSNSNSTVLYVYTHDDLSGAATPIIRYTSPSGKQSMGPYGGSSEPDEFRLTAQFVQYAEPGIWLPEMTLVDNSGNARTYTNSQLLTLGYDLRLTVTGTGDTTDPVLTGLVRTSPATANVDNGTEIQVTIDVTDDLSGVYYPTMTYTSASGKQSALSTCYLAGQTQSETLTCSISIRPYAETSVWSPSLILTDAVGNSVSYSSSQLLNMGYDLRTTMTGTTDGLPPTVSGLHITYADPPSDSIPYGSAVVNVAGYITDNMTGIDGGINFGYVSPSGHTYLSDLSVGSDGYFNAPVYLPPYAEGGTWQPRMFIKDNAGNAETLSGSDLSALGFDLAINLSKNITETAAAGATVTSDYEANGANVADPVEAWVTTPTGGAVSIVVVDSNAITDPTNGYTFFGHQVSINAPHEDPSALTLAFQIDSTLIPAGQSASTLQLTRNGTIVPACDNGTTATPDPCIYSRQTLGDGDIKVSVHSSSASAWASGFPSNTFDFKGFLDPVKAAPQVNFAQGGQVIPVKFDIGNSTSTNILAAGQPTVQRVNCSTKAEIGDAVAALASEETGLKYVGNHYQYRLKTSKAWQNTCQKLTFKLTDGSSHEVIFDL